jgi:hypothetical protein
MKKIAISIFAGALALSSAQLFAATAVSIQYGHVTNISTVQKNKQHAGGAMAGGLFGAVFARGRHRGLKIMASSAVGAAVQGASTSGVLQLYTVALVSGTTVQVSTEQQDIRPGDCVSVEQGAHTNIRRVGTFNCEPPLKAPPAHHVSISNSCDAAKTELTNAHTDDAVNLAVKKVRTLCED